MHLSLFNPYIRVAMQSILPPFTQINRRVIFDYELIYVEKGRLRFVYNDKDYFPKEGDVIFIMPGVPHSFHVYDTPLYQPHVHFDLTHRAESEKIPVSFKDKDKMSKDELSLIHENYFCDLLTTPIITIKEKQEFCSLFYKVIDVNSAEDRLMQKGRLLSIISLIIKNNFPSIFKKEEKPSIAKQIKEFIDSEQGLTMNLTDFENMFFYDKFYLEKTFSEKYGVSLIKYRNDKKLNCSKLLLKSYSVSEVAEKLGYTSIYAFSRAYKLKFGYPPSKEK